MPIVMVGIRIVGNNYGGPLEEHIHAAPTRRTRAVDQRQIISIVPANVFENIVDIGIRVKNHFMIRRRQPNKMTQPPFICFNARQAHTS